MDQMLANDLRITTDAYILYNKIAGMIAKRSLEILKSSLRESGKIVADEKDVQTAYHSAYQEAMRVAGAATP